MTLAEILLPEFDQEMAGARKVLERVPEEKFGWKPHEKSFSMGKLAAHLAEIPVWATSAVEVDELDLAPADGPAYKSPEATSSAELLAMFDQNVAKARAALAGASDAKLWETWSLLMTGKIIFTMPRYTVIRSFVLNHLVHHRAQLGVCLRLNDIPVPGLYGPSADEQGM